MSLRRVRALYIQPAPFFGGAERQAANNIPLLPSFGVDVLPLVGPGTAIVDWLLERGVHEFVHSRHFPGGWRKQRGVLRATLPWRYLECGIHARAQISGLIERHRIQIVIASLPFAWFTASLAARDAGIPIIWRAGGCAVNVVQKASLWVIAHGLRPDLLLCCAEAVRRTVSPFVPAPARVVLNGVDDAIFFPGAGNPQRLRPPNARRVVGCAIRLAASKRPEDFVMLARKFRDSHPDVAFLMAGEGSLRPKYEALARDVGATNLNFLGYVADMPSFYAACDIVVLPSRAEGCPNFLLESMAMRKAVIGADSPGVLELVRNGEDGIVYPIGRIDALAAALGRLLDDDGSLATLALRGYERSRRITSSTCAKSIADLVHDLVAERDRVPRAPAPTPVATFHRTRSSSRALPRSSFDYRDLS